MSVTSRLAFFHFSQYSFSDSECIPIWTCDGRASYIGECQGG